MQFNEVVIQITASSTPLKEVRMWFAHLAERGHACAIVRGQGGSGSSTLYRLRKIDEPPPIKDCNNKTPHSGWYHPNKLEGKRVMEECGGFSERLGL